MIQKQQPPLRGTAGAGNLSFPGGIDTQENRHSGRECCARHGGLDRTLTVQTKKGFHLFFRSRAAVPNSASRIAPHVDVRGAGGYVVGAPSVHPEGYVYAVRRDAPRWLIDLAKPPEQPAVVPSPPPLQGEGSRLRSIQGVV